jgi:hypothetical protein
VSVPVTGFKSGAVTGVEKFLSLIRDEDDFTVQYINEFVFVRVPMALTRPSSRG